MAWGGPEDYWFNRVPPNSSPLPAMQLGAQLRQQQIDNKRQAFRDEILFENSKLNSVKSLFEIEEYFNKREIQNKILQGNAALAGAIKDITDWTSPDAISRIADIGIKHPELVNSPQFKGALEMHQNAVKAKEIKARYDQSGYVPPDEETGAPGYFQDARGGIRFAPVDRINKAAPKWIAPNTETGMPAHFETADGRVQFPPRANADGTMFQPEEITLKSGLRLVRTSRNQVRVLDKNSPGDLTDVEKAKITDMRARRNAILDSIEEPSALMQLLFDREGGEKAKAEFAEKNRKKLSEVETLTKEIEAIYNKSDSKKPASDNRNPLGLDLNLKQ